MRFSTIIPTCNRAALLPPTLEAALAQEGGDQEVIVVDDGSTDDTPAVLARYGDRLRVLRQPNRGPGAARNLGLTQARGDYVAFLDSDDLWFPWTLRVFREGLLAWRSPAVLCGRLLAFRDPAELRQVTAGPTEATGFPDYFASSRHGYFVGSGMAVFKRQELRRVGGFLENRLNCEDHDLVMRLGEAAGFVQVKSPVTLGWRRHGGACTADFQRTLEGARQLISREQAGLYPGGAARAHERRRILTCHLRPVTLEALKQGRTAPAWDLYRQTLRWNLAEARFRYLAAFPWLVLASLLRLNVKR